MIYKQRERKKKKDIAVVFNARKENVSFTNPHYTRGSDSKYRGLNVSVPECARRKPVKRIDFIDIEQNPSRAYRKTKSWEKKNFAKKVNNAEILPDLDENGFFRWEA